MKNKIIYMGTLGNLNCYLNLSENEAISRYCNTNDIDIKDFDKSVENFRTLSFDDEFIAYDIESI